MTNEELVKALRQCAEPGTIIDECDISDDCPYSLDGYCGDCMNNLLKDAAAAIEALQAKYEDERQTNIILTGQVYELNEKLPHWVSVEQPPKERDFYFAFTADGEAKVCDYIPSVDQWWDGDDMILSVTHWMSVDPPKEVK